MKFTRILAAILILLMVSSQALASICSTSCMVSEMQSRMTTSANTAVTQSHHCDHQQSHKDQHQSKHQMCFMVGCHGMQGAQIEPNATHQAPVFSNPTLPKFTPNGLSTELSPPIKPPA